jgi:uncharacterized OsmC-like protein
MQAKMSINGVDVDQLNETVASIQNDPGLAKCSFRATNRWLNGGHNRANIHGFFAAGQTFTHSKDFTHEIDEPPVLLGEDRGANPVEYVLSALSGCLTSSLIYHAAAQGVQIDEVESTLEGDLDLRGFLGMSEEVRNGYENIRINFKIRSDAPQEKLDELVQLAQARSPVFDIVSHPVRIDVQAQKMMERMH